jgi:lipopolysaccharide transport system ATP-binding protein
MSDTIIRVENLGKKYLIKHQQQGSYTALRDVITDKVKSLGKKIISPWNHNQSSTCSTTEEFWALKDISFKVKQGEVVGIIGRNGAGKSTLLKILSRITEPTKGSIRISGRVASLLEVGTGFHPELTGRENIFLNGAILGMSRIEIKKKFDEIVAFAEVEKFLDTPVKHYSSGMYVRLAFAVAAHLEPEILIVDEVLAVGDAAFQKKCLGKMGEVAKGGRTVLFVSHNMAAVSALCPMCIYMSQGHVKELGKTNNIILQYLVDFKDTDDVHLSKRVDRRGSGKVRITGLQVLDAMTKKKLDMAISGQDVIFSVDYETFDSSFKKLSDVSVGIQIYTATGTFVTALNSRPSKLLFDELPTEGRIYCLVPRFPLMTGTHYVTLVMHSNNELMDLVEQASKIEVRTGDFYGTGIENVYGRQGVFFQQDWGIELDKLLRFNSRK